MSYGKMVNLHVKEGAPMWTARLINTTHELSIVHDRQWIEGGDEASQKVLLSCLNGNRLMPAIEATALLFEKYPERRNSEVAFEMFKDDDLVIRANPNRSHGYLYIAAARVKDVEPTPTAEEIATPIEEKRSA